MTSRIFFAFSGLTFLDRFKTREAVLSETPASRATSTSVGTCDLFSTMSLRIPSTSLLELIPTRSFRCSNRAKGFSLGFRIPKKHDTNLQNHRQGEKVKGTARGSVLHDWKDRNQNSIRNPVHRRTITLTFATCS